jgi:hypothetical protein
VGSDVQQSAILASAPLDEEVEVDRKAVDMWALHLGAVKAVSTVDSSAWNSILSLWNGMACVPKPVACPWVDLGDGQYWYLRRAAVAVGRVVLR